ncbi:MULTISPECIES: hypothetical protein [unclassified Massilia]|uniref:hypothetical protein n=1 Tax=unclassified Massilia TaxID=2609279 RepID=UPI00177E3BD1|nr:MULTISPECIES: hypothetical protein [unclassified Massilia]MBD8532225.1 hypothetical protein [Massilia sp. CFBP 13647]MBD8675700.1 hypothetical protein [Massilia sp. CFBP 13721]
MPDTHTPPAFDAVDEAPALWRPSAVAAWSLVFTPVFGSWLLMHNWRVLGQARAARTARRWLLASMAVLGVELFATAVNDRVNGSTPLAQLIGLAWLGLWLLAAAAPQWHLVRRRFGRRYARRGWNGALGLAAVCGFLCWTAGFVLTSLLLAFT